MGNVHKTSGETNMSKFSFKVYVDESGDEGFVFHADGTGSSRWLVLSAVVVRAKNDLAMVKLVSDTRNLLGRKPNQHLHFSDLKHEQRVPYVRQIAASSIRTVSVIIHKPGIHDPEKFQSEKFLLYHYATRFLLERVSWLCRDHRVTGEHLRLPAGSVFQHAESHASCLQEHFKQTRQFCP